jgi:hypothetical protein
MLEPSIINSNIGVIKLNGNITDYNFTHCNLNIEANVDLLKLKQNFGDYFARTQSGEVKFVGQISKIEKTFNLKGVLLANDITITHYKINKLAIEDINLLANEAINVKCNKVALEHIDVGNQVIKNIFIDRVEAKKNLDNSIKGEFQTLLAKVKSLKIKTDGNFKIENTGFQVSGITSNINFSKLFPNDTQLSVYGNTNWKYQAFGKISNIDNFTVNVQIKNQGLIINGVATDKLKISLKMENPGNININLAAKVTDKWQYLNANLGIYKANRPIVIQSSINSLDIETTLKKYFPYWANLVKGVVSGELILSGPTLDNKGFPTFERLKGNLKLTEVSLKLAGKPLNVETPINIPLNGTNFKLDQSLLLSQKSSILNF